MAKKKKVSGTRLAMFAVGMVIGLGLIIFDQFETIEGIISGTEPTGLAILTVPIDPATGGILGTIKLGAPDVVPFEQSGTHISTISPFCTTDFGRRLSGERNLDPVWWASQPVSVGSISKHCAYAYAQWDVTDIPNDFVATSVQFQLELIDNTPMSGLNCLITFNDFNIDTVPEATLINKLRITPQLILEGRPNTFPNTPAFVQDPNGTWCRTLGVKSFNFGQAGVDIVNNAIGGGTFDQGVRNDKLVLGFVPSDLGRNDGFSEQYRISNQFWATEGSWLITGSSPPIRCDVGFNQVDFRCIPIICIDGQQVDLITNECADIQCSLGEELQGNLCVPLVCSAGQRINNVTNSCETIVCEEGTQLIGSSCEPLFCEEGFEISGNECSVKTCPVGMELVGADCQAIQCPPNTTLSGNNCIEQSCPAGQFLVNDICQVTNPDDICNLGENVDTIPADQVTQQDCIPDFTCDVGFNQIGNLCYPIQEELVCPVGTEKFENICVQVLPDLMISQAPELGFVTILGIVIFGGSMFGLVGATRRI